MTILFSFAVFAQEKTANYRTKTICGNRYSIKIDSVSINPSKFIVKTKDNKILDSSLYTVDFAKALLTF